MPAAMDRDFCAQVRALEMRAGRELGGWLGDGGGTCCAREMERLFTGGWLVRLGGKNGLSLLRTTVWQLEEGIMAKAWRYRGAAR